MLVTKKILTSIVTISGKAKNESVIKISLNERDLITLFFLYILVYKIKRRIRLVRQHMSTRVVGKYYVYLSYVSCILPSVKNEKQGLERKPHSKTQSKMSE